MPRAVSSTPCGLLAIAFCLLLAGCVERQMTIVTEPPGAEVEISGRKMGLTPVTIPFTWYGDYDIVLRRAGYQTIKTHANINAPAYEIPPLDLLSDMAPWTYRDDRYLNYTMEPASQPTDADLIKRADDLRKRNDEPTSKPK